MRNDTPLSGKISEALGIAAAATPLTVNKSSLFTAAPASRRTCWSKDDNPLAFSFK